MKNPELELATYDDLKNNPEFQQLESAIASVLARGFGSEVPPKEVPQVMSAD